MSTKIYDGLIATSKDPFEVGKQIRSVLEPEFLKRFKSFYMKAQDAEPETTWNDLFYCNDDRKIEGRFPYTTLHEIIRKLHDTAQHTFSDLDIGYEVLLIPNGAGENPLILVFGEYARQYRELLLDAEIVKDYGYWDNADVEENITKAEWKIRKSAWSVLNDTTPAEIGLSISYPSSMQCTLSLMKPSND